MITSRRATDEDVGLFKEIRLKSLCDSPDAYCSTFEGAIARDDASWREQLTSTTSGALRNTQFAFDSNTCVGIAALYRENDARSGELVMMWVEPDYRGSNAATLLVQSLLDWAKTVGIESVELGVTDGNSRAIQFYENCGFQPTGEAIDIDRERGLRGIKMNTMI